MKIIIINGPNLNLVGHREPEIYGNVSFDDYLPQLSEAFPDVELGYFQSNIEGEIIDAIQQADHEYDAIIINPAAYSHTSLGVADAIASVEIPTLEVHISNIYAREEVRHISLTGKNAVGVITGLGLQGYALAVQWLMDRG